MLRTPLLVSLAATLCFIPGCGDGGAAEAILKRRSNLELVASAYIEYRRVNGESAAGTEQLVQLMEEIREDDDMKMTDAITSLVEGDVVVIWNGASAEVAESEKYVLAFEAGVPATGGYVVMGDGVVRLMTSKDYSEAQMMPTTDAAPTL